MAIVLLGGFLGFFQEKRAADAVEKLLAIVRIGAQILRERAPVEVPIEEIVPGDICIFNAGDVIPADCLILESKDLFVDEAALTGEGFPAGNMFSMAGAALFLPFLPLLPKQILLNNFLTDFPAMAIATDKA